MKPEQLQLVYFEYSLGKISLFKVQRRRINDNFVPFQSRLDRFQVCPKVAVSLQTIKLYGEKDYAPFLCADEILGCCLKKEKAAVVPPFAVPMR